MVTTQEKTEKENSDGAWVTPSLLRLCTVTNRPVNQPEQATKDLMSQLDGLTKDFQKLEVDQRKIVAFPRTVLSSEKQPEGK